ncbi:unnamed protein product [Peniophora sp. CBMAI 1063]|nr:unnamed protein product [Peniophora sp. CBMAI 1063]
MYAFFSSVSVPHEHRDGGTAPARRTTSQSRTGRRFHRPVLLQLSLDRYFSTSSTKVLPAHCFVNDIPLELLVEILVLVSYDTTHTERRHRDPLTLPDTDGDSDGATAVGASCIAGLRFERVCETHCHSIAWNWLEVTRVCKTWHRAAHSSAEFWSRVPLQTSDALSRSLELSGVVPLRLHVVFDENWKAQQRLTTFLDSQLYRIGELFVSWTSPRESRWPEIGDHLRSEAPQLRSLRLHTQIHCAAWAHGLLGDTPPPNLQEVELIGVSLPKVAGCASILAPTLVSLALVGCAFESGLFAFEGDDPADEALVAELLSSQTFFEALAMMPLLESLSIVDTRMPIGVRHKHFTPPARPVSLPHLRELKLESTVRVLTRMLVNIAIPADASLDLCFQHQYHRFRTDPFIDMPGFRTFFKDRFRDAVQYHDTYYSSTSMDFSVKSGRYAAHQVEYVFAAPRNVASAHAVPSKVRLGHVWDWEAQYVLDICAFATSLCELVPHNGSELFLEVEQTEPIYDFNGRQLPQQWYWPAAVMDNLKSLNLRGYAATVFVEWVVGHDTLPRHKAGHEAPSMRYPKLSALRLFGSCRITRDSILPLILQLLEHHHFEVAVRDCSIAADAYYCLRDVLGDKLKCDSADTGSRFGNLSTWVQVERRI